jgi:hypothetical protein
MDHAVVTILYIEMIRLLGKNRACKNSISDSWFLSVTREPYKGSSSRHPNIAVERDDLHITCHHARDQYKHDHNALHIFQLVTCTA